MNEIGLRKFFLSLAITVSQYYRADLYLEWMVVNTLEKPFKSGFNINFRRYRDFLPFSDNLETHRDHWPELLKH